MSSRTHDHNRKKAPLTGATIFKQTQHRTAGRIKAPPVVEDGFQSPGRPLDPPTRDFMESRFDHDFSQVRVHTGDRASRSAQTMHTRAYTVGQDIAFASGQYRPQTSGGRELLAHELAHVAQQSQPGPASDVESRAKTAARQVARGEAVSPTMVGQAAPGFYAEDGKEEEKKKPPKATTKEEKAFKMDWSAFNRFGLLPPVLTPFPSPALGVPGLRLTPPSLLSPPGSSTLPGGPLTPPLKTSAAAGPSGASKMPSRISVFDKGRFSLGLRLGFPELEGKDIPGMPETGLAASLRQAKLMNQIVTGKFPSGWEAVDKGKLAGAIWGIFSTHIAPDLAKKITSGLSASVGPGGLSYELDAVLLTDFSSEIGGGLSFTIRYPGLEALF